MKFYLFLLFVFMSLLNFGCARNFIRGNEPRICELHHVPLIKMVVPLGYGLQHSYFDEYWDIKKRLFPNSCIRASGGCVIGLRQKLFPIKHAKVMACPDCCQAEKDWQAEMTKSGKVTQINFGRDTGREKQDSF